VEDSEGNIWVKTDMGLGFLKDGRPATLPALDKFNHYRITVLSRDFQGTIWASAQEAGLFKYTSNNFVRVADEPELANSHCVLVDHAGRLWVGANDDLVLCHEGGQWHRYRLPRGKSKSPITALAEESNGTIWAGSANSGLFQFTDGKFAAVAAATGLEGSHVGALLTDRDGKLWVGTDTALNRLQRRTLFVFGQNEGLGFGAVQGLAEVAPGVIWAAKPNASLYRWEGRNFGLLPPAGVPAGDAQVSSLLVTRDGQCWAATANNLLLYKDPATAADEVKIIRFAKPNIISIAEAYDNSLWFGTSEGKIWQLNRGRWLAQTNLTTSKAITAIVPMVDGSIWFGTDGSGLYQLRNGSFTRINDQQHPLNDFVRTLHLDSQSTLWIGTSGGLSEWRNGRITTFTTREGLPDNTISQILDDDAGRLWLGTSRGIAAVSKQRLDELAAGKISLAYPQVFGRVEGMLSEECTGGFYPAGLKTKSGWLWFSTLKGVVAIDPHNQPAATPMAPPILEEVLVDGVSMPMIKNGSAPETLRIVPGKHRIEFRYTALNFDAPESMRFRYRLEGWDTDWLDAGTRRTAFYGFVPAGNYQFRVSACGPDGVWTENSPTLNVKVLRHFWQAWWFVTLVGAGFMIMLSGIIRLVEKQKMQRRLKRLEQEHALERERARIAQDLHDEMGAKLCKISFLSEHARRGTLQANELQDQIASISDTSREVLHSLDEIVWAVNPQNDTLEHVASYIGQYAQDYFQMTGILCELEIPAQLPAYPLPSQIRHHLFLATQEALTNILKHSGASHATISMICRDSIFEITVIDDGKGLPPSDAAESCGADSGNGLINMRERLTDIGGTCSIESISGRGTTIKFGISLNSLIKNI
jgi:signal transduction histidine kinase/ligand-binding sensor domain-containing protein